MKPRTLPLAVPFALTALCAAFPAQAQELPGGFNPMTFLAPIMTPFGIMMAPVSQPGNANPFNPATMMNPASMPNLQALMPFMPGMQGMPGMPGMPSMPAVMVPFSGLQAAPQAYGMPAAMLNPYAGMMPFPMPAPAPAPYPAFPGFPFAR